jgi:catechol 2,3-dioxygenase-like lactoylglutathione lyase family enzyme
MTSFAMILGGRHVGLPVRSLERSLAFYRDLLGFTVASDELEEGPFLETILGIPGARARIAKLHVPGGWMVELLEYRTPSPVGVEGLAVNTIGHAHLALTVQDVEALHRRLSAAGVRFVSPPQVSPSGRAKVAFCQDPDGYRLELVELVAPAGKA